MYKTMLIAVIYSRKDCIHEDKVTFDLLRRWPKFLETACSRLNICIPESTIEQLNKRAWCTVWCNAECTSAFDVTFVVSFDFVKIALALQTQAQS